MKKIQENLKYFTDNHKDVYNAYTDYGKAIHESGGPLEEKMRWLIKIAVSATAGYDYALTTHVQKALKAGITPEEIEHTILLIAPTVGFPRMMEALLNFRENSLD